MQNAYNFIKYLDYSYVYMLFYKRMEACFHQLTENSLLREAMNR